MYARRQGLAAFLEEAQLLSSKPAVKPQATAKRSILATTMIQQQKRWQDPCSLSQELWLRHRIDQKRIGSNV